MRVSNEIRQIYSYKYPCKDITKNWVLFDAVSLLCDGFADSVSGMVGLSDTAVEMDMESEEIVHPVQPTIPKVRQRLSW